LASREKEKIQAELIAIGEPTDDRLSQKGNPRKQGGKRKKKRDPKRGWLIQKRHQLPIDKARLSEAFRFLLSWGKNYFIKISGWDHGLKMVVFLTTM